VSSAPLALFDPRTATISYPADPSFGHTIDDAWLLLDDGLVVSVDTHSVAADPGAGWRVGQASCAGVVAHDPVQPYFSSVAPRPPYRSAGTVLPAAASRPAAGAAPAGPDRFNGKGKRLLGAAALGIVLVGAGWLRAGRRGALQAAVLLVVVGTLWWIASGREADARWQAQCNEEIAACLDPQTHLLRPAPGGGGPSRIPCEFAGLWNWSGGSDSRRMEMSTDGRFVMAASPKDANSYRGHWAVQRFGGEDKLVWRTVPVFGDWDVNAIQARRAGHFELVERDGSITRFDRLDTPPTEGCTP
jgi:hypothetical protein